LLSNLSDLHSLYAPNPFALRRQQLGFNAGQGDAEDVARYIRQEILPISTCRMDADFI
jgi:hypothetical protein